MRVLAVQYRVPEAWYISLLVTLRNTISPNAVPAMAHAHTLTYLIACMVGSARYQLIEPARAHAYVPED